MSAKFDSGRMYTFLKGYALGADMPNTLQALVFARKAHEGQTRKSGEPYIVHPLTMACHAITLGIDDDEIVAACLLHDVVEDTDRDVSKLPVTDAVIDAVNRLTHEKGEPLEPYYRLISLNRIASVVKLLDRCDNVSTMAGVFTREKCLDYIRETRDYVLPLLRNVKDAWPQYSDLAFVLKYHIYSVIDGLEACLEGIQAATPGDATSVRPALRPDAELISAAAKAADAWRGTDSHGQAADVIDSLINELRRVTGPDAMPRFYFTYGSNGRYPFQGGWTLVLAPDRARAVAAFRVAHPDVHEGIVNCADIYDEDQFRETGMLDGGNMGFYAHELIRFTRDTCPYPTKRTAD